MYLLKRLELHSKEILIGLTGTLTIGTLGAVTIKELTTKNTEYVDDIKLSKIIADYSYDDSDLDDSFKEYLNEYFANKDKDLIDEADTASRYIDGLEVTKDLKRGYDDVNKMSKLAEEEYCSVLFLSVEEIKQMKKMVDKKPSNTDKSNPDLVKLDSQITAYKRLDYFNNYADEWLKENGEANSEELLMGSIKAAVGYEFNIDPKEVDKKVTIEKRTSSDVNEPYEITVKHEGWSKESKTYNVNHQQKVLHNALDCLYNLQRRKNLKNEDYDEAIDHAKLVIMSGVETDGDNLMAGRSMREVKELIKK